MGAVFSVVQNPSHLVESVLSAGVAVTAGNFYPFNIHYFTGLSTILPLCEPAETDSFENFSVALDDWDEPEVKGSNLKIEPSRFLSFERPQPEAIWRSRTVAAKKLHKLVAFEAQRKAARFSRRYRLYGPPDWVDPALSLLPPSCVYPPVFLPNILPSVFPFAAPHIVLSPPSDDCENDFTALANGLQMQDQANGNRLIVADPPSRSGPVPSIINPSRRLLFKGEPEWTYERLCDEWDIVPWLTDDESSICGSSEWSTESEQENSYRDNVSQDKTWDFWIDDDEDTLPDLPESWKPKF